MSVAEFNLTLRQHFPGAPYCLDYLSTLATGKQDNGSWKAKLDIFKLDNWIIARHGEYDCSMRDRVKKLFGEDAVEFILQTL